MIFEAKQLHVIKLKAVVVTQGRIKKKQRHVTYPSTKHNSENIIEEKC